MLLLLNLQNGPILKGPLHNIGIRGSALDGLALGESGPEIAEILELDHVPDIAEAGFDDGGFGDVDGGWDAGGGHFDGLEEIVCVCVCVCVLGLRVVVVVDDWEE